MEVCGSFFRLEVDRSDGDSAARSSVGGPSNSSASSSSTVRTLLCSA